ncbi:MAG TPA: hypothetical protein VH764_14755 [Gemmatimonadales bacterium]|jgi:hypothetical protein
MIDRFPRAALACVLALTLPACGGGDSDRDDPAPAAEAGADAGSEAGTGETASPAADSAPGNAAPAPVTVADIDSWQKGTAAELQAVRAAGEKMKEARTNEDTLAAMMAVQEMATQEAGAKAAGMDLERYKFIRSELSAATSYLTPQLGGIDTTMLSPAQRDELRQGNEAQLKQMEDRVPPAVVEALRPRAEQLRKQDLELVAQRLKSAGM